MGYVYISLHILARPLLAFGRPLEFELRLLSQRLKSIKYNCKVTTCYLRMFYVKRHLFFVLVTVSDYADADPAVVKSGRMKKAVANAVEKEGSSRLQTFLSLRSQFYLSLNEKLVLQQNYSAAWKHLRELQRSCRPQRASKQML